MDEVALLRKKLEREKAARLKAEHILEQKSRELFKANQKLQNLNQTLEATVSERTAELQQMGQQYQQIVEQAIDLIYRTDAQGHITYVNQIAEQKYGYQEEEIIGQYYTYFVPETFKQSVEAYYQQVFAERREVDYAEFPAVAKDGQTYWFGQEVRLVFDAQGAIKGTFAVARDITDRKQSERRLRETQTRLKSLIANLQAGILVEDQNRRIVLSNHEFCRLFSIPAAPDDLIGGDCVQALEQAKHLFSAPEAFSQRITQLLYEQNVVVGDVLKMVNGTILERDYIPIFVDQTYFGHLWQYRDVTEQKRAAERLRESEEKYRGIMENMELGLLEVDNQQIIQRAYDSFCRMTGYRSEELIGRSAPDIFLSAEAMAQMKEQEEARKKGETNVYEIQIRHKDGHLLWVLISGAPIRNVHGEVVGSIGIHYDITDRKLLEEQLRTSKQEAEDARAAEQQFLARMSHEIRTPLNAILGMTHLLYDTPTTEEQENYLSVLKRSADILLGLVSDVLDFNKIQKGEMAVDRQELNVPNLLNDLQHSFDWQLTGKPVELHLDLDQRIHPALLGDELMMNQVFMNLLGNAVKFTDRGSITLGAMLKNDTQTQQSIRFYVQDTGVGIPSDELELIFQHFKQARTTQRATYGGTGLGLTIARQLVALQGGKLEVDSAQGKGTTFYFTLQFPKAAKPAAADLPSTPVASPPSLPVSMQVLIVEDNVMNQTYVTTLMRKWGYDYHLATHGQQAIRLADQTAFDLILMDLYMPDMDGYEATQRLRQSKGPNQHTPIIALTASATPSVKERVFAAGMNHFLTKPFRPPILREAMMRFGQQQHTLPRERKQDDPFPAALDTQHLAELYGGDLDYAAEMFDLFLSYTLPEFRQLATLLEQADTGALAQRAHKVKPAFSMVGLTSLTGQLDTLERAAKDQQSVEALSTLYQACARHLDEVIPALEYTLAKLKNQSPDGNKP